MKRSRRTKKRYTNTTTATKQVTCEEVVYYPPPPSIPITEKATKDNPIPISSQKDLEALVNSIGCCTLSPEGISTPPIEKARKKIEKELPPLQQPSKSGKQRCRKRKDEDEDYVDNNEEGDDDDDGSDDDNFSDQAEDDSIEEEIIDLIGTGSKANTKACSCSSSKQKEKTTKTEERSTKKKKKKKVCSTLPQSVRNRIASQEFRQRQKAYILELEQKVNLLSRANGDMCGRLRILVRENSVLRYHLGFLRNFISKVSLPQGVPTTAAPTVETEKSIP